MKISSLWGKIAAVVVVGCCTLSAQGKYGGGTGEPNDPYLIYTAEQMNEIGLNEEDWDRQFKLMADIDLSGFTGTAFNIIPVFTGVFDGNDHTISNFNYASADADYVGLFGNIDDFVAEIRNLGLIDPNIDSGKGDIIGSLAGRNIGTITSCYVQGGSVAGDYEVGTLVGENYQNGRIANCYSTGHVSGLTDVGGLVGHNRGRITKCCFFEAGSVTGLYNAGGLVGFNYGGSVTDSYATGSVSGNAGVGGAVGFNRGIITNCYATGEVSGTPGAGGLVGGSYGGAVEASFWDTEATGRTTSAGGTGLKTAQMQTAPTFIAWAYCDEPVWSIDEGRGYPRLWWENAPGERITVELCLVGSGTQGDPYLIYKAEQFNAIGLLPCLWDKHLKLMADIDLGVPVGISYNIIATSWRDPFTGVFDGNDHIISNFTYYCPSENGLALFQHVGGNAQIKDLGLIAPNVSTIGGNYIASLVSWLYDGTITNCYVEGGSIAGDSLLGSLVAVVEGGYHGTINNCYSSAVVSGDDYIGGLVGLNNGGTISNCYSIGDTSGDEYVGRLVGSNVGTITNCYSIGDVEGTKYVGGLVGINAHAITYSYSKGSVTGYAGIGGLVGYNYGGSSLYSCCSTGSLTGSSRVGGLVGYNTGGEISNCYSTASLIVPGVWRIGGLVGENYYGKIIKSYSAGAVTEAAQSADVGGLVGYDYSGTCTASFWDVNTSGQLTSACGIGRTTAKMQMKNTYVSVGWDFITPIWKMNCEGMSYPKLSWWQPALGDFDCPDGVNFIDYSFFASHWRDNNCTTPDYCEGTDFDKSGIIDSDDLWVLLSHWLTGIE